MKVSNLRDNDAYTISKKAYIIGFKFVNWLWFNLKIYLIKKEANKNFNDNKNDNYPFQFWTFPDV